MYDFSMTYTRNKEFLHSIHKLDFMVMAKYLRAEYDESTPREGLPSVKRNGYAPIFESGALSNAKQLQFTIEEFPEKDGPIVRTMKVIFSIG